MASRAISAVAELLLLLIIISIPHGFLP